MHPFGGTPICPRCNKAVYAAEQAMGPGRKLYHKPCLACKLCNKRLDSYTLLEHDLEPYCKTCHVKNFGTKDLRRANLPHRDDLPQSPTSAPPPLPISPVKSAFPKPTTNPPSPRTAARSPPPILRANSALPSRYNNLNRSPATFDAPLPDDSEAQCSTSPTPTFNGTATNNGRGAGGLPRTVPLSPVRAGFDRPGSATSNHNHITPITLGRSNSSASPMNRTVPLAPNTVGTRYGLALAGAALNQTSPTKQWGGTNPICPKCSKSVYFAEQVKAVGKTWHKGCLRCTSCNTSLDSTKLTEKEDEPFCHRCYSKLHGPQGSGYALLGKAGG